MPDPQVLKTAKFVLIVAGIFFCGHGVYRVWDDYQFQSTAMSTEGTVVKLIHERSGSKDIMDTLFRMASAGTVGGKNYPVFRYSFQNQPIIVKADDFSLYQGRFQVGNKIKVFFQPQAPFKTRWQYEENQSEKFFQILSEFMEGLFFMSWAFYFSMFAKKDAE